MRNKFKNAMFVSMFLTLSAPAWSTPEDVLTNICYVIANNDISELRKKDKTMIQDYNIRLDEYFGGISCGGKDIIEHASYNKAQDVLEYIIKRISKSKAAKLKDSYPSYPETTSLLSVRAS